VNLNSYANESALDFSAQALINSFCSAPLPAGTSDSEWNPGEGPLTLASCLCCRNAENAGGDNAAAQKSLLAVRRHTQLIIFPTNEDEADLFGDPYRVLLKQVFLDDVFYFGSINHRTVFISRFNVFSR